MTTRTFENCFKFRYTCTNHHGIVFEHRRMDGKWISEKRDRYGNRMGTSIRTDAQMQPIFNHMQCVAECDYYSRLSTADLSCYV
jgi:hypothetical protein